MQSNKVLFNNRRHRVQLFPCVSSSGLISLRINCANFFQQGKHELAYGGGAGTGTTFSLIFFSLLLGKHFGVVGGGISLCAWCYCTTGSFFPVKTRREELPLLQLWGRFSWVHKLSRTKELEAAAWGPCCFLVEIGLFCMCFVLKREMNCLEAMKVFWLSDASRRRWSVKPHLFRAGSVAVSREEGRSHLAHNTLHNLKWQTPHSYEMSPGIVNIHTEQSSMLFTSSPCKLLNDFCKTCWGKE